MSRARKAALFLGPLAVMLACDAETVHGQSALDGFDPNANGPVRVVVVQPDGKVLLGGEFTTLSPNGGVAVTRNHIARLNPDGTLDNAFNPSADGIVFSIAVQADGKVLAGGTFTSIGGRVRSRMARLDAITGLADSFDPNANNDVWSIAVQADGKILVGGYFSGANSIGGQTRNFMARLDPATGLADSFDAHASGGVLTIAVQADGKILVGGGQFTSIGGQTRHNIARLDPATGLADSFDPNANSYVLTIAVQTDGKVLASGEFTSMGGQTRNRIARLDATTGQADSFDPNASDTIFEIALQPDGKILACGEFTSIGGQTRRHVARLDANTGQADSFNPNANSDVWSIAVQPDGKILMGGYFNGANSIGGQARNHMARVEVDGRVDRTLNLNVLGGAEFGQDTVTAIAVQPDGKTLIGGTFTTVLGVARNRIARLNTDGTLDTAFDPNASGSFFPFIPSVVAIAVQADGKILVGGKFSNIGGQPRNYMARLDPTTGLADSFDPSGPLDVNSSVNSILVQPDGKILVCGQFAFIGGAGRNDFARLDPTTGLADSFDAHANNSIFTMALQPDGKIILGGFFSTILGQPRNKIARLDPVIGLADSFNPNADDAVFSLQIQPDSKVLAGGWFRHIGGHTRNGIARLDPVTGLADSFDPAPNNVVDTLVLQANGKVLLSGQFTDIGGTPRDRIARVDGTTGLADLFDPHPNNYVYSIAVQASGKILLGGPFTSIGGQRRAFFARFSDDTAALQNLGVTQNAITWTLDGTSPQFARVTFESSNDNVSYVSLGAGVASGSNWTLAGLSLPAGQNLYIRARGNYSSGYGTGSESIMESIRNAFFAGPSPTPSPTFPPSPTPTPTATVPPSPTPPTTPVPPSATPTPMPAAQAINLSTRMKVQTGDNVGIGGFIITGTAPKHVLLRAIGPSLAQFGVPDVLADPVMELHGPGGFATVTNNDWREDPLQEAAIIATGIPPSNNLEAAIDATLDPGAYTAIVRGNNNTTGIGLVEVYDLSQAISGKLANMSTRAFVDTGDNIVIAGFILGGNGGNDNVILRGMGPSLGNLGVPLPLADPTLELRDSNGAPLAFNNDWQDNTAPIPPQIAPGNPRESVIVATLPPGLYTVLLAGLNNGTGVGLVEVYDQGNGSGASTPTPAPTATPTPSGTPSPIPTPVPVCVVNEGFDDIATLPWAGWVQINHSVPLGTTGWFQGNGAVFPAQTGAQTSYIAANYDNGDNNTNPGAPGGQAPASRPRQPATEPTPTPVPSPTNAISNWLLTPPVTLQNGAMMTFYTRTVDVPQFPDRLQVRMSTHGASTNVGTAAFDVGDFTVLLLDINPNLTTAGYPNMWTQFTVTVSGVASPTTGRLALRYFVPNGGVNFSNGDYIGIDQVSCFCTTPTPTPPPPTPSPAAADSIRRVR